MGLFLKESVKWMLQTRTRHMIIRTPWLLMGFLLLMSIPWGLFAAIPDSEYTQVFASMTPEILYSEFSRFNYSSRLEQVPEDERTYYEIGYDDEDRMVYEKHYKKPGSLILLRVHQYRPSGYEVFEIDNRNTLARISQYKFTVSEQPLVFRFFNQQKQLIRVKAFHSNGEISRIIFMDTDKQIPKQDEFYGTQGNLERINFYDRIGGKQCLIREEIYEQDQLVEYSIFTYTDEGEQIEIKTYNNKNELIAQETVQE